MNNRELYELQLRELQEQERQEQALEEQALEDTGPTLADIERTHVLFMNARWPRATEPRVTEQLPWIVFGDR